MTATTQRGLRRVLLLAGVTAALGLCVLVAALGTRVWAEDFVAGERLLPGVRVAGVEIGGMTIDEARATVAADAEQRLDRHITLHDGDRAWDVTPRDLDGQVDVEEAVATAADASAASGWARLAAARWVGADVDIDVRAEPVPDAEAVRGYLALVGEDIDTAPVSASARWEPSGATTVPDEPGRALDRAAAAEGLEAALRAGADEVELPVVEEAAAIKAADVDALLPALDAAVAATLDSTLAVSDGDATWHVPVRDVARGAVLHELVEGAVALAADGLGHEEIAAALGQAPMTSHGARISALVADLADEVAVAPVDAGLDYSTGWVDFTPAADGRALDEDGAADAIRAALRRADGAVALPVEAVEPRRTRADFRDVLLVRQDERRLYHYRDGEIVADWPVAVGTASQPTPTGEFTIGAKRRMPTWHNPAADRWGADMPDVIGPGPDNPLGVRALNWHRNGADTLIRFHGTSQVDSIGRAASNGCVRLTNGDVVELYDRIPHGTTVVSVHG